MSEWKPFLKSLGVEPILAIATIIAVTLVMISTSWALFRTERPTAAGRLLPSKFTRTANAVSLSLISALLLTPYLSGASRTVEEPFQIVFGANSREFRSRTVHPLELLQLNEIEQAQRKNLVRQNQPALRRNVVVIIVEGFRPDHLSILGYGRSTTPSLQKTKDKAVNTLTVSGHSVCAESFCGILSILASRYYSQLPSRPITIGEILNINGYTTRFLLSGDHSNFFALRELYGPSDQYWDGSMGSGDYVNDDRALLDIVDALPTASSDPEMLYIHAMGPHLLSTRYRPATWLPEERYGLSGSTARGDNQIRSEGVVNFYDNGVAQADALIARVLDKLSEKNYLDNALIVITSDHGESLGEHGSFGHAKTVREHALRVPILFFSMGRSFSYPMHERALNSTVDIAPTILHELGIEPPSVWQGIPLQAERTDSIRFQQNRYCGAIWEDTSGRLIKYWRTTHGNQQALYDLSQDRHESVDLFDARSSLSTYSRRRLKELSASLSLGC